MKVKPYTLWTDPFCEKQIQIVENDQIDGFGFETVKYVELKTGKAFFVSTEQFARTFIRKVDWIKGWRTGRSAGKKLTGIEIDRVG